MGRRAYLYYYRRVRRPYDNAEAGHAPAVATPCTTRTGGASPPNSSHTETHERHYKRSNQSEHGFPACSALPHGARLPKHHKHQRSGNAAPLRLRVLPHAGDNAPRISQDTIHRPRRPCRPCGVVDRSKRQAPPPLVEQIRHKPRHAAGAFLFTLSPQDPLKRSARRFYSYPYKHTTHTTNAAQRATESRRRDNHKNKQNPATSSTAARRGFVVSISA